MFYQVLLPLPAAVCLFWAVLYCMTISRTEVFGCLVSLIVITGIYFFVDSCYSHLLQAPPRMLMHTAIGVQLAIPSMIPLAWLYLHRLRTGSEPFHAVRYLWIIFPFMLFSLVLLLTLEVGPDQIEQFIQDTYSSDNAWTPGPDDGLIYYYYLVTVVVIRVVIVGEALIYTTAMAVLRRRHNIRLRHLGQFFAGGKIRVLELQFFLIAAFWFILLFKIFALFILVIRYAWAQGLLAVLFSISIFLFCYVALFSARKEVTLRQLFQGIMFNYRSTSKQEILEDEIVTLAEEATDETLLRVQSRLGRLMPQPTVPDEPYTPGALGHAMADEIFSAVAGSWADDDLLLRLKNLMLKEHAFLNPSLSLGDVAERIHSNKTYVSRLVNSLDSEGFPNLINTLRVDYAQRYIVEHRKAKQTEIAAACGFVSASTFNNTFKRITGVTPKIWLATYDQRLQAGE